MLIVTAKQMKEIEANAQESGLDAEQMMENAGSAAASVIISGNGAEGRCITVFCGRGNNGGDGFVAARHLSQAGATVAVVLTDGLPRTGQAKTMFALLETLEIPILEFGSDPESLTERLALTEILVDAIYGTGFHGALDEKHRGICRLLNGVGVKIFALDIPSGVNSDTGAAEECAVRAAVTVVFDCDKPATVMPLAAEYCGDVIVADIGIPPEAHTGIESAYTLVDRDFVFGLLPRRPRDSHKGTYGKLLNVAGSADYMGAAALSTLAAMRTGVGYVTLASTGEVCRAAFPMVMEAVMLPLERKEDGSISYSGVGRLLEAAEKSSAVLLGNGLGSGDDACRLVYDLLENVRCPLILDADGINAVSRNIDILRRANCEVILTPHLMELSRLTTLPVEQLRQEALPVGLAFAREYHVTLVLKSAYTTVVTPDGKVYFNTTGNAGMAKAGSGDVLAGIIGSLAAQGYPSEAAAACGVWLHGLAGDYAAQAGSQYAMLPRDMIDALPAVFRDHDR